MGRELGKWEDLRCCHRWESQEGLGAPEALGDRVDPAWGGQQALSVTFKSGHGRDQGSRYGQEHF